MDNNNFPALLGPNGQDLIRLLIRCLHSLGYNASANQLELESGLPYPSLPFVTLRSHILAVNWEQTINTLTLDDFINIENEKIRAMVLFLILKQCIIEHLCHGDDVSALAVIRRDYSALGVRKERIHHLVSIIINKESIGIEGTDVVWFDEMRQNLVTELENLLPPRIVVPERRLESLVKMALDGQRNSCIYHNSPVAISPYEDHCCGKENFPTQTVQVLTNHTQEIYFIQFSNNGRYLASGSSDSSVIIWTVPEHGNLTLKHTLYGHKTFVSFISWSPDDTMLLTCEVDLKLWDVETGTCKHRIRMQSGSPSLMSCAWFPDSNQFVFGGSGSYRYIGSYKINENRLTHWPRKGKPEIMYLAITPNGKNFICIFLDKRIAIWNIDNLDKGWRVITEVSSIHSFSLSGDGQYLLVNLMSKEIHIWDINAGGDVQLPIKYECHNQVEFGFESCFGGWESRFIAAGADDSKVYIWNRQYPRPIEVLSGHTMKVNCVCWNPTRPQMLVSGSDDKTIRIWGPPGLINNNQP